MSTAPVVESTRSQSRLTRSDSAHAPWLSIVIASVNDSQLLKRTLDSLDALPERDRMEVVVVGANADELDGRRYPIRLVSLEQRLTIPAMRYEGVMRARGDLIGILEDHVEVDRGWAAAMLEAHGQSVEVGAVGGPVENGQSQWINWAVYFCEYAPYMKPVVEGVTFDLPGNNIVYRREHLLRHAEVLRDGQWESWINDRLVSEKIPLVSTNRAEVRHIKPFRLGYFLKQRFLFARSYAGMRRKDQSWSQRLVYGCGSVVLPALLTLRAAKTVLGKKRLIGRFLACSPLVGLFFTVGAIGEMIGYLVGPGRSLEQVE